MCLFRTSADKKRFVKSAELNTLGELGCWKWAEGVSSQSFFGRTSLCLPLSGRVLRRNMFERSFFFAQMLSTTRTTTTGLNYVLVWFHFKTPCGRVYSGNTDESTRFNSSRVTWRVTVTRFHILTRISRTSRRSMSLLTWQPAGFWCPVMFGVSPTICGVAGSAWELTSTSANHL